MTCDHCKTEVKALFPVTLKDENGELDSLELCFLCSRGAYIEIDGDIACRVVNELREEASDDEVIREALEIADQRLLTGRTDP